MPSISLVSLAAFELRIDGGIDTADEPRAQAALEDASALVREAAGEDWLTDAGALETVPEAVIAVVVSAARRSFLNPEGVKTDASGDQSTTFSTAEVYLTKEEKRIVRSAAGTARGAGTIQLEGAFPIPVGEFTGGIDDELADLL